jgi:hypothetical protein
MSSVGFLSLWTRWRDQRRWWWLLPVTLVVSACWQVWLIVPATEIGGTIDAVTAAESGRAWLAFAVMASVAGAILGLALAPQPRCAKGSVAFALVALLAVPALWAAAIGTSRAGCDATRSTPRASPGLQRCRTEDGCGC